MKKKNLATICALSITIPMALYAPVQASPGLSEEMTPPVVEKQEKPEPSKPSPTPPTPSEPVQPKLSEEPSKPEPEPSQPKESKQTESEPEKEPKPQPEPSTPSEKPKESVEQPFTSPSKGFPAEKEDTVVADAGEPGSEETKTSDGSGKSNATQESKEETPQTKDDKMVETAVGVDQVKWLISLIGMTLSFGIILLRFAPAVFRKDAT